MKNKTKQMNQSLSDIIYNKFSFDTDALIEAINNKNIPLITKLIRDSNRWSIDWNKCLTETAHIGSIEIIKLMINNGATNLPLAYSIAVRNHHIRAAKYFESIMDSDDPELFKHARYFANSS